MMPPAVLVYEDDPAGALARAAALLSAGECIVYPTDTIYGLLAHLSSPDAYQRIYLLKERAADQPLALLVHPEHPAAAQAQTALAGWPEQAREFVSGMLTVVLAPELATAVPAEVQATQPGSIGLRQPADSRTRALLAACGGLLWATSVNRSGQPPAMSASGVQDWLKHIEADLLPLAVLSSMRLAGSASAVVRLTRGGIERLR